MKLTNAEKLILIMLSEIYEKLGIGSDTEIDPKFVKSAIFSNNTWGLPWKYSGIPFDGSELTPTEVTEVVSYLDMWSFIEAAYKKLDARGKDALEEKAGALAKHVQFRGFDGNNESEYMSIARFMIDDLERFESFKGRDLNSHMPSVGSYRRMYQVFEPIRRTLIDRELNVDELAAVLKAVGR